MRTFKINGKEKICFVVTEGEVNDVVIPVDRLAPIDYQRISALESELGAGGHLMAKMRDHTLDNGVNCLVQYQDLLVVVKKNKPAVAKTEKSTDKDVEVGEVNSGKKKGPGRPKGSKNKKKK